MSQSSKEAAQTLREDFKHAGETVERYKKAIPDPALHKKLDAVKTAVTEVVKHVEKSLEP